MPWHTGDSPIPTPTICRRLRIPDQLQIRAAVDGALLSLAEYWNWEEDGTATVDETAAAMWDMVNAFYTESEWCMLGVIVPYASATLPDHMLECDGSTHLRTDFPALYAVLDAAFIVDADHFVTPNMIGNVVLGSDGTGGSYPVGATGGEIDHVLTVAELAAHSHIDSGHAHTEGSTIPTAITIGPGAPAPSAIGTPSITGSGSAALSTTGSDSAHNNLQPYLALHWAIVCE